MNIPRTCWLASAMVILFAAVGAVGQSRTGVVHFENSGAAAAQADFQTGLTQLHNFQYEQAEELFKKAEAADPGFAMAYCGEALTHVHPLWNYEDLAGARAVLLKLAPTAGAAHREGEDAAGERVLAQCRDIVWRR